MICNKIGSSTSTRWGNLYIILLSLHYILLNQNYKSGSPWLKPRWMIADASSGNPLIESVEYSQEGSSFLASKTKLSLP